MKKILFLIVIAVFSLFVSCKKCKELQFCPKPEIGEKYFSNYKEGTSWVYGNRDGTKKDSIYVYDYKTSVDKDRLDKCIEWNQEEMKLFSKYLSSGMITCFYDNPNCDESYFAISGAVTISLRAKSGIDTLQSNQYIITQIYQEFIIDNNIKYNNVVKAQREQVTLWFAPNIGIIQYTTYDNSDTLYFQKIYTK